jgi:hypothetical protein
LHGAAARSGQQAAQHRGLGQALIARHLGDRRVWFPEAVAGKSWHRVHMQVERLTVRFDNVQEHVRADCAEQSRKCAGQRRRDGEDLVAQVGLSVVQAADVRDGQD